MVSTCFLREEPLKRWLWHPGLCRWGNTPLSEAQRVNAAQVVNFLRGAAGAKRGN
jgi:hypothetical protein